MIKPKYKIGDCVATIDGNVAKLFTVLSGYLNIQETKPYWSYYLNSNIDPHEILVREDEITSLN